jgi:hypothetical protein
MTNELALSEDGYLLQKVFHSKTLKEVVDISHIDLKKSISMEDVKNDNDNNWGRDRRPRKGSVTEAHCIQKLYVYREPREGDIICWYDDIGALSGSAGFVLIRDGYVIGIHALWRS